jgi:hypothetical protein
MYNPFNQFLYINYYSTFIYKVYLLLHGYIIMLTKYNSFSHN